jgi:uncharacterized membrane protein YozB (DUF420 family)
MGILGTAAGTLSDIGLLLEVVILFIFFIGVLHSRRHLANRHYKIMTAGFTLNLLFVATYMAKNILEGGTKFPGPIEIYRSLYLPVVIVHGIASVLAFLVAAYTVYYGYTHTIQKAERVFVKRNYRSTHRRLGYATLTIWSIAFVTGIVVYLLLYVLYT